MATATAQTETSPPRTERGRPIVECQRLTKIFKDFWMRDRARAVDDLSMRIYPREVFGLLGPNGSGKSTTIKMILGLLKPTRGRVSLFGKHPTDVAVKKRVGYLPEESYLYPFLNARETLDYYGKLFEIDRRIRMRRIDELLDMVGLTAAQFRPVREYSKGMQRRIGIAQALINDPDFLILDEPTTGLDPIGTRQVKDLILQLGRRGKTVLLSSHLLADVEDVVDHMVILYGGRIRREGSRDELLLAQERTTIETDRLDDATIAEIDRIIRARTGTAVTSVSHPRQKLEELFMDIVRVAQSERAATSGASNEGVTAAFLRQPVEEGEDLIGRLVGAGAERLPAAEIEEPAARQPAPKGEPRAEPEPEAPEDVLEQLLHDEQEPAPAEQPAAGDGEKPAPKPALHEDVDTSEVDQDVIGSLLDDQDKREPGA
ncbi:MAG: ATP-binding cassette domain-containing protein [Phycisphaerales bacterium JB039]